MTPEPQAATLTSASTRPPTYSLPPSAINRVPPPLVHAAPLVGVLLLALLLRMWGIAFGLPYVFHPDEPRHVNEALGLMSGAPDALSFENPGLYRYVLVVVFQAVVGGERLGELDPSYFYLLGRAVSAVAGVLSVGAIYGLARAVAGHRGGLIAATFGAVSLLLVRESHFAVNDMLGTLAATLALWACVCVAQRGRKVDYLAAGVTLGLAFAAKYQAAIVLVPLLIAHLRPGRHRRDTYLLVALGAASLTAVVAFPPLITETARVVGDVWVNIVLPSRLGWEGLDRTPGYGYLYYLKVLYWGLGIPLLALAGVGAVRAVSTRNWPLVVVVSLPVVGYAVLGGSHIFFARYLLPVVPPLIVLAAVAVDAAFDQFPPVAVGVIALVLVSALPNSMRFDTLLTRTDTRTLAREWIASHVAPTDTVIAEHEAEGPPLEGLPQRSIQAPTGGLFDLDLDTYRRQGVVYVVTSSYTADAPNIDPRRNSRRVAFYATLDAQGQRVAEFLPYVGSKPDFVYDRLFGPFDSLDQFDRPGPGITIYRIEAIQH